MREIGKKAGGLDYKVAEKAVERFGRKVGRDRNLGLLVQRCLKQMSDVGT